MFVHPMKQEKEEQREACVNRVAQNFICYRCGHKGHTAKDSKCPAASEKCDKCGLKGHFAKCCKTQSKNGKRKKRHVKYIVPNESDSKSSEADDNNESENEHIEMNSIFTISSMDNKCTVLIDDKFPCQFIIDSGASINIVDKHTFNKLISSGFCCKLTKSKEKYFAYGGRELDKL
uniref:Aspartic protease n=1 Tax=Chilo suppressalis TaxID=168631 RepID=A0A076VEA7_CHISP|nr:aspartic protease [Chilo suppressalis]AIK27534.1 aspartic protease [Chilo suppressalis]